MNDPLQHSGLWTFSMWCLLFLSILGILLGAFVADLIIILIIMGFVGVFVSISELKSIYTKPFNELPLDPRKKAIEVQKRRSNIRSIK